MPTASSRPRRDSAASFASRAYSCGVLLGWNRTIPRHRAEHQRGKGRVHDFREPAFAGHCLGAALIPALVPNDTGDDRPLPPVGSVGVLDGPEHDPSAVQENRQQQHDQRPEQKLGRCGVRLPQPAEPFPQCIPPPGKKAQAGPDVRPLVLRSLEDGANDRPQRIIRKTGGLEVHEIENRGLAAGREREWT